MPSCWFLSRCSFFCCPELPLSTIWRIQISVPPTSPDQLGSFTGLCRQNLKNGPENGSTQTAQPNFQPATFLERNGRCSDRFFIFGRLNHSRMHGRKVIPPTP